MPDINGTTFRNNAILGLLLAFGLIIGGWVLGAQIKATRLSDRYVTVKGLVERKVKSDLAIWPLTYKEAETISRRSMPRLRQTRKQSCSFSPIRTFSRTRLK